MNTTTIAPTGASHADLCKLLDTYAKLIRDTPARQLDPKAIADALGGFSDTLGNLHDEPGDDRDTLTVAEHRAEIGMCPDDDGHFYGPECGQHECPTWREAVHADRVAYAGWTR